MAAILQCGQVAMLSHASAAALLDIASDEGGQVHVTEFVTRHRLIPVTVPALTFVDYATEASHSDLERAVNGADKRDRIDPEALRQELDRHAGRRGVVRLRTLLDRHTFRLSDEELERRFRPIAAAVGLPPPLTKVWIDDFEVDFFAQESEDVRDVLARTLRHLYARSGSSQAGGRTAGMRPG